MCVWVCACVCVSVLYRGYTVGPTMLKFGMEDHIYLWEVIGYILMRHPNPLNGGGQRVVLEVHAAQTVQFCENFKKQKFMGTPENGGTGQVRSGPRPHSGVRQLVQVEGGLLQAWSRGHLG